MAARLATNYGLNKMEIKELLTSVKLDNLLTTYIEIPKEKLFGNLNIYIPGLEIVFFSIWALNKLLDEEDNDTTNDSDHTTSYEVVETEI